MTEGHPRGACGAAHLHSLAHFATYSRPEGEQQPLFWSPLEPARSLLFSGRCMSWLILLSSYLAVELVAFASVPSVLLRRQGHPLSASAWLIALVAMPLLALPAWWLFGRLRLERRLRKRSYARSSKHGENLLAHICEHGRFDDLVPERARNDFEFCCFGNRVELFTSGQEAFQSLEKAIEAAKESIHLFFYAFLVDDTGTRICDRLIERAREGVKVRVVVDGFGSQGHVRKLRRNLSSRGIQFAIFMPRAIFPLKAPRINFSNHRKIVVVDERVAYSGGMNVGEDYERHWRDVLVRYEGPIVAAFSRVFAEDWKFATRETLDCPHRHEVERFEDGVEVSLVAGGPDTESWIHDAYFAAIVGARQRVWITTPYLIPTPELSQAIRTAAGRGVDVRIIAPKESDVGVVNLAARSFYWRLVADGVRVFEYETGVLHAKTMVVDDWCCIGTANLDNRSMRLSFELCTFVDDQETTESLVRWMKELERESLITAQRLSDTSRRELILQSAAHLFAPLL